MGSPISRLRSVSLDMTNEIASFAGFDQGFDITEIGQAAATVDPAALIEPEPVVTGRSMSGKARPTT